MDSSTTPLFELGVPHPVECRLPDGHGGIGSERECVSNQGVVRQRILVWEPEKRLSFRMEQTDIYFRRFIREIVESFDIAPVPGGVQVTRTTRVEVKGHFQFVKRCLLFLGLKQVHHYVFRNWQKVAAESS